MSLEVKFNGIELSEIIDVEKGFNPFDGTDWDVEMKSKESAEGSSFLYSSRRAKVIEMPFRIKGDVRTKYDKLQTALAVSSLSELTFGNIPDRRFMAISSGTTKFVESATNFLGHGTITWIIPSGVSEAINPTVVNASINSSTGVLTAEVDNNSSADIYPLYRLKFTKENGYIGINQINGSFEMGYKEETDRGSGKRIEQIFVSQGYNDFAESNGWVRGVGVGTGTNFGRDGTFKEQVLNGTSMVTISSLGTDSGLHGASMMRTIDTPVQDFHAQAMSWFETGRMGQTALMEFVVGDEQGNHLASLSINKNDMSGNTAYITMHIKGVEKRRVAFEPSSRKFKKTITGEDNGQLRIDKNKGKITFYFGGQKHEFNDDSIVNLKAKTITLYTAQWGGRTNSTNQFVSICGWRYCFFNNNSADYSWEIINTYQPNDEVIIDCNPESPLITQNDRPVNDQFVDGSNFYPISIGTNNVEFYFSSWTEELPTVTVEYRKRWG